MRPLLLFFIAMPILEMAVLIQVGGMIGALPTVALVVLTATIGLWLLRMEGLATLNVVQQKLAQGSLPGQEVLEGIMLIIGGALLLTPGFITDAIGFSCLLPFLRKPIALWLINSGLINSGMINPATRNQKMGAQFSASTPFDQPFTRRPDNPANNHSSANGTIIDGEFIDQTKQQPDTGAANLKFGGTVNNE
ncbi:MAG: FxsA family protein [Pseudomonadales bacterium]|nr:FxsA family protein [Pseudomonadales bacterium]